MKPTFYDFFAGSGLVEQALHPTWRCLWANDIDPRKAAVHALNFDHSTYLTADIAQVRAESLPHRADMAWASFPCQDLSLAGWRRGMGAERSGTFWAFWRIMRDLFDAGRRPPLIVIENVAGLLYGDNFAGLCEALAALNMRFGALLIDADRFVPQSRPRVFVVAVEQSVDVNHLLQETSGSSLWLPKRVREAYASLSPELQERWCWWALPMPTERVQNIEEIIEDELSSVAWHSADETARLLSLMSEVNLAKIEQAKVAGGRQVGFLYKRTRKEGQRAEVRFDGVAGCLRTPYGGSSRQTVVIIEDGQVRSRLLSPREAARLMGAPDSFRLPQRYNDAYRAMGDGVAVPAVRHLSECLLLPLVERARLAVCHDVLVTTAHANGHRETAEALAARWLVKA